MAKEIIKEEVIGKNEAKILVHGKSLIVNLHLIFETSFSFAKDLSSYSI